MRYLNAKKHLRMEHVKLAKMKSNKVTMDKVLSDPIFIDDYFDHGDPGMAGKNVLLSRAYVARALLMNGVPFNCLAESTNPLRVYLETSAGVSLPRSDVSDTIPLIRVMEMHTLRDELANAKHSRYAIAFDGTTDYCVGELLLFTVRFVDDKGNICIRLAKLSMYERSHSN